MRPALMESEMPSSPRSHRWAASSEAIDASECEPGRPQAAGRDSPIAADLHDEQSGAQHIGAVSDRENRPVAGENEGNIGVDDDDELDPTGAPFCWICRDPDLPEPLVAPCQCRGSMRGVHASCLEAWITQRQRNQSARANSNPLLSNPRCDLCMAPLQVVRSPAGRGELLSAHLSECRQRVLPWVMRGLLLYVSMALLALMYAFAVNDGLDFLMSKPNRWLWRVLFSLNVVICWLIFLAELLALLVSYPWSVPAPRNRLLRFFHIPPRGRPYVLAIWYHLYCVPCIVLPATFVNEDRNTELDGVRWCLLFPVCVLPLLPHLKGFLRSSERCSRQGLVRWTRSWRQAFTEACGTCSRRCCVVTTRKTCIVLLSPTLPWLQVLEAVAFGIPTVADVGEEAGMVDILVLVMISLGLASSLIALAVTILRGPHHESFRLPNLISGHVHFAWWGSVLCLVYFALLTVCAATDGFENDVPATSRWTILCATGGAWLGSTTLLALYSNVVLCASYCQNWRLQHGEAHIVGAEVVHGESA